MRQRGGREPGGEAGRAVDGVVRQKGRNAVNTVKDKRAAEVRLSVVLSKQRRVREGLGSMLGPTVSQNAHARSHSSFGDGGRKRNGALALCPCLRATSAGAGTGQPASQRLGAC